MPEITDGGSPHTRLVMVGTTPVQLAPPRMTRPWRSALLIQQSGNATVYIGGPDVMAGGSNGDPVGVALSVTPPGVFATATSNAAYYGVVASGSSYVTVLEEY